MNLAALIRAALRMMDAYAAEAHHQHQQQAPPRPRDYAPLRDIGPDPTTREFVWRQIVIHQRAGAFPGGRPQFEAACNAGWVRVRIETFGYSIDVAPPGGWPPPPIDAPPRSREAPPPSPVKNPMQARALAMKTLGYKKLDAPAPPEIKERYRDLARRHHPDLAPTPAKRVKATERMQRINDAYALLKDQRVAV